MAKAGNVKDKTWGGLGGNNKMHGWSGTGPQEPGQTAQEGTGSKRGIAPKAGGQKAFVSDNSKHGREMNQKHGSNTDYAGFGIPGTSASTKAGSGDKNSFAKGGTTSMHGNTGSVPQQGGRSSQQ
jgi:hypothetical protein